MPLSCCVFSVHLIRETDVIEYTAQIPVRNIIHGAMSEVGNMAGQNDVGMKLEKTEGAYRDGGTILNHPGAVKFQGDGKLNFSVKSDWELVN